MTQSLFGKDQVSALAREMAAGLSPKPVKLSKVERAARAAFDDECDHTLVHEADTGNKRPLHHDEREGRWMLERHRRVRAMKAAFAAVKIPTLERVP